MTDKQKLEKIKMLADTMYNAAFNITTDSSRLKKAMYDYHQFIINEYYKEEPVSNDLEETLKNYAYQVAYDLSNDWLKENATWDDVETAVKLGAQWQKQQLMKDAVDGVVFTKLDDDSIMVRTHYFKSDKIDYLDEVKLIIIEEE